MPTQDFASPLPDLRALLEGLPDAFLALDAHWRVVYANGNAIRFAARPAAEVIGANLWALYPEILGTIFEERAQLVMRERLVTEFEAYFSPRASWIGVRAFPYQDGVAVHFRDVTARHGQERRARALQDITTALMRPLGRDDVLTAVFRHAVPALGASVGSVALTAPDGAHVEVFRLDPLSERRPVRSAFRHALTEHVPVVTAMRERRTLLLRREDVRRDYPRFAPSTSPATVAYAIVPLEFDERVVGALILSFVDESTFAQIDLAFVTSVAAQCATALERARLAGEVDVERALVGRVLDELPVGVMLVERDSGRTRWVNRAMHDLIRPEDLLRTLPWLGELGEADTGQDAFEVEVTRSDGTPSWLSCRVALVREEDGALLTVVTASDVTERREVEARVRELNSSLEQRVRERTRQLEALNEELEAFSYGVSHDLRAPVRHVLSFLGLLRRSLTPPVDERAQRYLDIAEGAASRMNGLIDDLLAMARSAQEPVVRAPVALGPLVEQVRADVQLGAGERHLTWRVAALPTVEGDAGLLRQVLTNLLGNAVKYSRTRDEAVVEVWADVTDAEVRVFVRDNGVGFDPRYASRLFGVFQRLHRAEEFEGNGVGLANVKRIVQRHGGRVWAESSPGEGATFSFSLPR
ncbi:ATP-binding protein [Deinococcus pimensis]|uniref:ATP-binding protein n=1 Tax=Deinococcus pimensis TaxID=309888 RepID=UPI0004B05155|nr:ATP-binding protein [Deinococcus pimensis]